MKILFIITRNDKGGSSEFLLKLINHLKKEVDIKLIYGGRRDSYEFNSKFLGSLIRQINPIKDLLAFFSILIEIIRYRPDIIHTHTSKAGFLGRWAGFIYKILFSKKVKIIHTPHGHVFYGYFGRFKTSLIVFLERLTSYITDILVALTDNERIESLAYGVGNDKKWVVIPSGIEYSFRTGMLTRKDIEVEDDEILVGSVMRIERIKGWECFVKAANVVLEKKNRIRFIIVGDGTDKEKLKDMLKRYKVKEKFILPGWVDNVYDWISLMDIYVQPSLNEGLGRTILIAELLSKAIVASSVCGIKDLVKDGYNGVLFPPADYLKLAKAIIMLVENPNLRKKMAENSHRCANEVVDGFKRYSIERSVYLHKKVYGLIRGDLFIV